MGTEKRKALRHSEGGESAVPSSAWIRFVLFVLFVAAFFLALSESQSRLGLRHRSWYRSLLTQTILKSVYDLWYDSR